MSEYEYRFELTEFGELLLKNGVDSLTFNNIIPAFFVIGVKEAIDQGVFTEAPVDKGEYYLCPGFCEVPKKTVTLYRRKITRTIDWMDEFGLFLSEKTVRESFDRSVTDKWDTRKEQHYLTSAFSWSEGSLDFLKPEEQQVFWSRVNKAWQKRVQDVTALYSHKGEWERVK